MSTTNLLGCGYCDQSDCDNETTDLDTVTIISEKGALAYEIMHLMKSSIVSADGYERDLDGLEGFTAYINTNVLSFMMEVVDQFPEITLRNSACKYWAFVFEVMR